MTDNNLQVLSDAASLEQTLKEFLMEIHCEVQELRHEVAALRGTTWISHHPQSLWTATALPIYFPAARTNPGSKLAIHPGS